MIPYVSTYPPPQVSINQHTALLLMLMMAMTMMLMMTSIWIGLVVGLVCWRRMWGCTASYDCLLNDSMQVNWVGLGWVLGWGGGVGGLGVEYISLQCVTTKMIVGIMSVTSATP